MSNQATNTVDTRRLKSGQTRLRFKLSESAHETLEHALDLTGYKYNNSSLDAICLSYLAGDPSTLALDHPAQGQKRFLVRLYPDEYEIVREALNLAKQFVKSDAEALILICLWFIAVETSNKC